MRFPALTHRFLCDGTSVKSAIVALPVAVYTGGMSVQFGMCWSDSQAWTGAEPAIDAQSRPNESP